MLVEMSGNIWEMARPGDAIIITTNGDINSSGRAVMGRGIAKQAAMLYPEVSINLAAHLNNYGNVPGYLTEINGIKWFSFPVKHHWYEKADIDLIKDSASRLYDVLYSYFEYDDEGAGTYTFWMPRPGCGNGRLKWEDVKPVIAPYLEEGPYIVVNYE